MSATEAPAYERFQIISEQVHDVLVGAAQCRNHLTSILGADYPEPIPSEAREDIEQALNRLTRVGI